jgi:hypothetical protein
LTRSTDWPGSEGGRGRLEEEGAEERGHEEEAEEEDLRTSWRAWD